MIVETLIYTAETLATHTARVASFDVVVGAREHVLYERVESRVVDPKFRSRVDRVVKAVRRRRVRVRVEKTLNSLALRQ